MAHYGRLVRPSAVSEDRPQASSLQSRQE